MITKTKNMNFIGLPVYRAEIIQDNDVYEASSIFGKATRYVRPPSRAEVELTLIAGDNIQGMQSRLFDMMGAPLSVSRLGDTIICRHCGFRVRPGVVECLNCGSGVTSKVPKSRYDSLFRFTASELNINGCRDGFNLITIRLLVLGKLTYSDNMFGEWHTTHREDGWLCAYCNSVNHDSCSHCQFCGAGELPYSDISHLSKNCLYCGCDLNGLSVCRSCASAQQGYSMWLPSRDKWN